MTKEKKTTEDVQGAELQTVENQVSLPSGFKSPEEAFKALNEAEESKLTLNSEYLEFQAEGENVRAFFDGFTYLSMNDDQNEGQKKDVKCVKLIGGYGVRYVCGSVSLVSLFEGANLPSFHPVSITYKGKKGRMKLFELRELKLKVK
jgi:hypothetical protein